MRSSRLVDGAIGLVFAGLGAGIIAGAANMPGLPGMAAGSGFFPTITGAGMVLFGLLLSFQGFFLSGTQESVVTTGRDKAPAEGTTSFISWYRLLVLAALAILIAAMPFVGFIVTGVVFATTIARLGGAGWAGATLFALTATLGLYAVFVHGLHVPLPRGIMG